jgi:hypothetical protein
MACTATGGIQFTHFFFFSLAILREGPPSIVRQGEQRPKKKKKSKMFKLFISKNHRLL